MAKTTSIILDDHFEAFVRKEVDSGRYATVSEVVRDALRRLERSRARHDADLAAIREGVASGVSPLRHEEIFDRAIRKAKKRANKR